MNILNVVIHQINKEDGQTGHDVRLIESLEPLDCNNELVSEIINHLNESFSKRNIIRAVFDDTSPNGFVNSINDFQNIDLMAISRTLVNNLYQQIMNIAPAKGGYIIFALYDSMGQNYLGVFLVRKTLGSNIEFNEDTQNWGLEMVRYLDVKNFAMGLRINLTTYLANQGSRYLQLVRGNTDIARYFEDWVGISSRTSESIDGNSFFEVINQIEIPAHINLTRDEIKQRIYNYARDSNDNNINIRELSNHIFGSEEYIIDYCERMDIDLSHEFKLRGNQLRRFFKISVTVDGITLQASYDKFNPNEIEVLDDCVIIRSPALVHEIRESQGNINDDTA